jgi:hypothetical protein
MTMTVDDPRNMGAAASPVTGEGPGVSRVRRLRGRVGTVRRYRIGTIRLPRPGPPVPPEAP